MSAAGASRYLGSAQRLARARKVLATGVATAMRADQRPQPLVIERGSGSRIVDIDGNEYIDYVLGFGPLLLGHRPPMVNAAVVDQLERGATFGAQHRLEAALAERLVSVVPCAELTCFSTTGSEAVQVALRIARAWSARPKIVKFEGHYHGWIDPVYVSTPGLPPAPPSTSPPLEPVPASGGQSGGDVLVARWNDAAALEALLNAEGESVAAILMEPVACNGGLIEPRPGFLERVSELASSIGALVIFDEVVTGFRLALGGAQERYGVTPDLAVYGKAIGAGLPLSAVVGSAAVMEVLLDGRVPHVGTFNCNPISAAAAVAAIDAYRGDSDFYGALERRAKALAAGLAASAEARGVPLAVRQVGPLLQTSVAGPTAPADYAATLAADTEAQGLFSAEMLDRGVMVLPRGWWFLSSAHSDADVEETVGAAYGALERVVESIRGRHDSELEDPNPEQEA
jgi:glutamate-1-semialdehyde 2,1-aminomutase